MSWPTRRKNAICHYLDHLGHDSAIFLSWIHVASQEQHLVPDGKILKCNERAKLKHLVSLGLHQINTTYILKDKIVISKHDPNKRLDSYDN